MPPKSIATYFKPAATTVAPLAGCKRLSDTARKAIIDAKDEASPAKKARTVKAPALSSMETPTITIPRATSREELRKSLEDHPEVLALLELELETLGEDWLIALQDELTKPYFLKLKKFVIAEQKTKKVFPPAEDIYSWSRFCALKDVRVIIVGQDPYHDDGQAHGLAFSVRKGVKIPPSLRNMYKEMANAVDGFVAPTHGWLPLYDGATLLNSTWSQFTFTLGTNVPKARDRRRVVCAARGLDIEFMWGMWELPCDLTEWARHGVLLLNTSLTVRAHEAASHSKAGWDLFTAAALRAVTTYMAEPDMPGANGLVLMAWGKHAQTMIATLDTNRHLVLKSGHPSPLSARLFFNNGHFTKSNTWLRERYGADGGIDWKSFGA